MGKNVDATHIALMAGMPTKPGSIWTDGRNVYSYQTCIAAKIDGVGFVVNVTDYSPTTRKHQSILRLLPQAASVDRMRFGATYDDLVAAAYAKGSIVDAKDMP